MEHKYMEHKEYVCVHMCVCVYGIGIYVWEKK